MSSAPTAAGTPVASNPFPFAVVVALVVAVAIEIMPLPASLSEAGRRILAILAFALIVWLTAVLDYAVSSVLIVALLAIASRIIFDQLQAALLDIRHNRRF